MEENAGDLFVVLHPSNNAVSKKNMNTLQELNALVTLSKHLLWPVSMHAVVTPCYCASVLLYAISTLSNSENLSRELYNFSLTLT